MCKPTKENLQDAWRYIDILINKINILTAINLLSLLYLFCPLQNNSTVKPVLETISE
jgi:hypothetical protein